MTEIRGILDAGGIRIEEAAELFKVCRGSVYHWINGAQPRNKYIREEVLRTLVKIVKATKQGRLPVQDAVGKERMGQIQAALQAVGD